MTKDEVPSINANPTMIILDTVSSQCCQAQKGGARTRLDRAFAFIEGTRPARFYRLTPPVLMIRVFLVVAQNLERGCDDEATELLESS